MYHVVTRAVNGEFLFGERDREVLRRMLWQAADFSGVQVLTYCILSNHFHILVRVPAKAEPVSDAELLRRCRAMPPKDFSGRGEPCVDLLASIERTLAAGGPEAESMRRWLLRRMGDVSEFMKTLKQRFSVWYNHNHQRYGTLWAERFKSVLVEDERFTLATVAAYIDLNPVRAGLVADPKDYRFCGYGEAVGEGGAGIRAGLGALFGHAGWNEILSDYRMILFGKGMQPKADGSAAAAIAPEEATQVLNAGGRLPAATVLRCRVRYFTDGAVLGSPGFVAGALRAYQQLTGRRKRQAQPRPVPGAEEWGGLASLRGLRTRVFG